MDAAVEKALGTLSGLQNALGGFSSWGKANPESNVQAILALGQLGLPMTDSRFVKNNNTLMDDMLRDFAADGGFSHARGDGAADPMSTEQGLLALAAWQRAQNGQKSVFDMTPDAGTCTVSIECKTILAHMCRLNPDKRELVPADGIILPPVQIALQPGDTAFSVLQRIVLERKIHMEHSSVAVYGSAYIEGINNLYEFDCGPLSGWTFSVNGAFSSKGCSLVTLADGDAVKFLYTCDLGKDVGDAFGEKS